MMSTVPAPYPGFVGPLREYSNPIDQTVAAGSGPSAQLWAAPLLEGGTRSYVFKIHYRDDVGVDLSTIDDQDLRVDGPFGYTRRAALISRTRMSDGTVVAYYKVAPPGGAWDAGDNGRYTVTLLAGQVRDVHGLAADPGLVGDFAVAVRGVGGPTLPPPGTHGINILDFGAVPNDGIDDTAAIEAAINALPVSNGAPIGNQPAGGIVYFPAGTFTITRSIKLHSGVTLRGAGSGATIIHDISTNRNHAAILLYSPYSHHWNIGAGVEDLTIYSRWGGGVWVDPDMGGDVVDLHLANLRVSTQNTAIDLRYQAVYHSEIDNVEVYNPGSTALHVGRLDGHGAGMRVRDFRVTGRARAGFRGELGLVRFATDTFVQGLTITATGCNVTPIYVSDGGYTSGAGGLTMYGLTLTVPAANCPGGYAIKVVDASRVDIEFVGGVGATRRIWLQRARDVQIGYMQSDGTSNVLAHLVRKDERSYVRVGNAIAGRLNYPPRPPPPPAYVGSPAPTNVIDARAFGVIADDGLDDTAALQAAINSLPRGDGIPGGTGGAVGGIVQLPLGAINTAGAIKLPSGVWLRGHNNGTVIRNLSLGSSRAVIEFTSPYAHGSNVGAGLIELGIFSNYAAGMKADATVVGELRDLRVVGVRLTTGGPAVDLSAPRVNHARIERVVVSNPGSWALWLGRADNSGIGNVVRGMRTAGLARANFTTGKAMFVYYGDTTIEGGSIEDCWSAEATALIDAFYASGTLKMDGLYMEFPRQPNGIGFLLENMTGANIDRLHMVNPWRRLHLANAQNVLLRHLNIDGVGGTLRENIGVDDTSRLTLNTVNAQFDAGMLDHPRITVRGVYNGRSQNFVETQVAVGGTNLLADPDMLDVTDEPRAAGWQILFGDQLGEVVGTYAVETVGGVKRLRITILRNDNDRGFAVHIKMNVPASAVGKRAIARWRVDGDTQAFAYRYAFAHQYAGRAMKSMTAASTGAPLDANERLWIVIPNAVGTYYISKVGMVAVN